MGCLSQAQEKERDESDSDLNAHGILGRSEEVADFEGVLDPAKEQLDLPSALVECGNGLCGRLQIVCRDAKDLCLIGENGDLTTRFWNGFLLR